MRPSSPRHADELENRPGLTQFCNQDLNKARKQDIALGFGGSLRLCGLKRMSNAKYMQTLDSHVYSELKRLAKERGVSVQELVRAVIVPDWMRANRKRSAEKR